MSRGHAFAGILATFVLVACEAAPEPVTETTQELGNSEAAHCCIELFPPGAARGQCVEQAAHGLGPCAPADAAVVVDAAPPDAASPPDAVP